MKEGRLAVLGVIQEQHADRCRLFAQWKGMGWPILHDPINVLEPRGVPIVVAIDEHGIVRSVRPRAGSFESDFLNREFRDDAPGRRAAPLRPPDQAALRRRAEAEGGAVAWRELGDALALWGGAGRLNDAIDAYSRSIKAAPRDGNALFRLGVCHRMRHESVHGRPGDFQAAIDFWGKALATNRNQYIWRRRIQQYGPRLDKPYPFYDWVKAAAADIRGRGEKPVALAVEPYGAEIAHPAKRFAASQQKVESPDPRGEILRDAKRLVGVEVAVVPGRVRPGGSARVHLTFRPATRHKVHWNNAAGALQLWMDAPAGWGLSSRLLAAPRGERPETREIRRLDFEVQAPPKARGRVRLRAYALYYVCEDVGGTCQFLRQDVPIEVRVGE